MHCFAWRPCCPVITGTLNVSDAATPADCMHRHALCLTTNTCSSSSNARIGALFLYECHAIVCLTAFMPS
jgi:hypothetical protein